MTSGKRLLTDGMEQPNQEKLERLEKRKRTNTWASWKLRPSNKWRWKKKLRRSISGEPESLLERKLCSENLIKGINTWAVPLVRYSGRFLKWTRDELKQINQRKRKLMTMHKALHPKADVDRIYVSKKGGGRVIIIEDSVDTSIQWLKDDIEKREGLITATRNDTDNSKTNRTTITRKQKWEEKQHHGRFKRLIRHHIPETTLTDYMYQEGGKRTCQHRRQRWHIHTTTRRLHESGLITAIRNNTDTTIDNRMTKTRKQKWEGKQLHGRFKRLINNI